jgi:GNAT superfamily N-acetyltransferase
MIKQITYNDILSIWTKNMPNMSLEPTSAMSCFRLATIDPNTHKYDFVDHYDLENQKFTPTFWGAFDDDKLIGVNSGHMTMDRLYRSRGLFVDEAYRNQGIGKKLLLKTSSQAYHEKAIAVWSYPKYTAWLTYAKAGFNRSGYSYNFDWIYSEDGGVNTRCINVYNVAEIDKLQPEKVNTE